MQGKAVTEERLAEVVRAWENTLQEERLSTDKAFEALEKPFTQCVEGVLELKSDMANVAIILRDMLAMSNINPPQQAVEDLEHIINDGKLALQSLHELRAASATHFNNAPKVPHGTMPEQDKMEAVKGTDQVFLNGRWQKP